MDYSYLTQKIYEAYRKLKNYYYYDNSSLFTRVQIAKFEEDFYKLEKANFKSKFSLRVAELISILNNEKSEEEVNTFLENRIDFVILPKQMNDKAHNDNSPKINYITNSTEHDNYSVGKYNLMIDAAIDIHLISTLWVMFVGVHLSKITKNHNYAYQFSYYHSDDDNKNYITSGLQMFKPYFKGYQDWRDNALKKAEEILNDKRNATIISLDVKRYFYSVRLEVSPTIEKLIAEKKISIPESEIQIARRLSFVLDRIHKLYSIKIAQYLPNEIQRIKKDGFLLPVGLESSGVLGNLYLNDFDELVVNKLHPDYYGRYVDDMLFVLGETKIEKDPSKFLKEQFVDKGILDEGEDSDYKIHGQDNLTIQSEKVIIEHFVHYESRAALAKFRNNIQKQRSEFRLLPDEDIVEKDFDEAAFSIHYSGSINKIRDIKDFTEDKYGAATYLAHKIFLACYDTEDNVKDTIKTSRQIQTFFNGNASIEFYSLWEKVFTFFVIKEDVNSINMFQNKLLKAIDLCSIENSPLITYKLKYSLCQMTKYSLAMPLSMHYAFIKAENEFEEDVIEMAIRFRQSNMFRHQLLGLSGLNLTNCLIDEKVNLFKQEIPEKIKLEVKENASTLLAPHHIHYDDLCMVAMFEYLYNHNRNGNTAQKAINNSLYTIPEDSFKNYIALNYGWHTLFYKTKTIKQKSFVECGPLKKGSSKDDNIYSYRLKDEIEFDCKPNKKIAIANLIVDKGVIQQTAIGKVNLKLERRNDLFKIINEALRYKCDMLILPELSVPYQWLDLLVEESKKHNLAIIAGLTYIVGCKRHAYNTVVTILPVKTKHINTCVIIPRVKNHYAPGEMKLLSSYGFRIPKTKHHESIYHLYHWRKSYFSVYNCFELASIEDRALLKSKVDFVVATELNTDINYYSDIAGSWVRDIHSFFIQVNSSEFGDSRITKPSKTEEKNLVRIKGGKNSVALVEDIDIVNLRNFQLPGYAAQEAMGGFKPTPPEYNHDDVRIRIADKDFQIK